MLQLSTLHVRLSASLYKLINSSCKSINSFNERPSSWTVYVCGSEMEECVVEELHQGLYKVVMFSPESLLISELWRDMLLSDIYRENTVGFIVDEAHCVKKWLVNVHVKYLINLYKLFS